MNQPTATMAPQQPVDFDGWDDDEMIVPSARIISSCPPQSQDCDCELGEAQSSSSAELNSTLMTPKTVLPPSILRGRLSPAQQQEVSLSSPPPHWPRRQRVHFADGPRRTISSSPPSVVTAIYYRPRTPIADVSSLYYSALDVKNFKREFRALLRSQKLARQRLQQNSEERLSSTDISDAAQSQERTTTVQHHDNSFWRSKVSRWSAQTKATSAAVTEPPSSCINKAPSSQINDDCEDDVDSPSSSSQGGIFSSVFDVAREAASLFGTSSGSSAYYQRDRAPQQNQNHLIDTLYLF